MPGVLGAKAPEQVAPMECQTLRMGEGLASQRYYLPMKNHIAALPKKGQQYDLECT